MEIPGYTGNLAWLAPRTIYLTRHGSHAYGLATPTSDLDVKGVAVPPRAYLLGFLKRFEQAECKEPDTVVFELRKFVQLAADANPNVLEMLFTDPADHLGVTPLGERLLAARELFVSRKARHTFSGYAMAQLRRLEQHHRWLVSAPPVEPRREDFGLDALTEAEQVRFDAVHAEIDRLVRAWDVDLSPLPRDAQDALRERLAEALASRLGADRDDDRAAMQQLGFDDDLAGKITGALAERVSADSEAWRAAARHVGLADDLVTRMGKEREYRARARDWEQFAHWKKTRNDKRAALEAKFGYDTKFGAHVVRLLRMCREILTEGRVLVRRPDREELLAVRNGAWPFEQLKAWAAAEDAAMEGLLKASKLPHAPDRNRLDALCVELVEEALRTLPEA